MLLTRLAQRLRKNGPEGTEGGYVLAAVMALLLLVALLSTAIISSVLGGITVTSAARATVQSQAAAEAGVDVVLGALVASHSCAPASSALTPRFTTQVSYTTTVTASPFDAAVTWVGGCPSAKATFVKVVSVGVADVAASGTKNTGGNSRTVEGILAQSTSSVWSLFGTRNVVG